jgi:hypothetical protein
MDREEVRMERWWMEDWVDEWWMVPGIGPWRMVDLEFLVCQTIIYH